MSPETKKKIVDTRRRNNSYVVTEEHNRRAVATRMKNGSYVVSEETKQKKRKPWPEELKEKLKGRTPWNKEKTGVYTTEALQQMKASAVKRGVQQEILDRLHKGNIGKQYSRNKKSK